MTIYKCTNPNCLNRIESQTPIDKCPTCGSLMLSELPFGTGTATGAIGGLILGALVGGGVGAIIGVFLGSAIGASIDEQEKRDKEYW